MQERSQATRGARPPTRAGNLGAVVLTRVSIQGKSRSGMRQSWPLRRHGPQAAVSPEPVWQTRLGAQPPLPGNRDGTSSKSFRKARTASLQKESQRGEARRRRTRTMIADESLPAEAPNRVQINAPRATPALRTQLSTRIGAKGTMPRAAAAGPGRTSGRGKAWERADSGCTTKIL